MEEDQEVMKLKHVCKFCRKSFASGKSLGGHMRSHDHDHDDDYDDDHDDDGDEYVVAARRRMKKEEGYGLRENPKKTWRVLTDSTNEQEIQDPFDVVLDKLCKECGKGFQSMKALFGHMKCHKKKNSFELDEEEEEEDDDSNATVLPKRKRRSKRKLRTRYNKSNTSTSVVNFGDNSLDSIAESSDNSDEKEQEEVAMSLIMLSRDVRPWFGINSIAEFSDNNDDNDNDENSLEFEAPLTHLVSKIEGKKFITNSSEIVKMNKKPKKLDFGNVVSSDVMSKGKSLEVFDNDDGLKMKKARVSVVENGKDEKKKMEIEVDSDLAFEVNVVDSETKVTSEGEFRKRKYQKRGKFECATCNKKFQSYQALGGHRASHKRTKGFSASRNDQSSENGNSAELELEVDAEGRMVESERVMLNEEVAEMRDYLDLDLNLPAASIDDERNGHSEIYKPWWLVGSSLKQEAMVGLLSN
ncbi:uncharacterized protein [Medicago truncatula]|uniref:C2H2-type zinc finger protein n=2 Tax=Medicago truncatula TaxID=3880 RepID=A0A072UTD3_MEDTR|nr:uncharacterized protein LOC25488666 [Medicago truncatula]KEH33109.1 C2H2-type zinc finger protein [Medicago truncatula]